MPRDTPDAVLRLFAAWRAEIDSVPGPELIIVQAGVAAVATACCLRGHQRLGAAREVGDEMGGNLA